jgi:hypothetical protein
MCANSNGLPKATARTDTNSQSPLASRHSIRRPKQRNHPADTLMQANYDWVGYFSSILFLFSLFSGFNFLFTVLLLYQIIVITCLFGISCISTVDILCSVSHLVTTPHVKTMWNVWYMIRMDLESEHRGARMTTNPHVKHVREQNNTLYILLLGSSYCDLVSKYIDQEYRIDQNKSVLAPPHIYIYNSKVVFLLLIHFKKTILSSFL